MSRPPAARGLALHFFLWKQLPGQEIGLGGIRCSIFCRVLHQQSSLSSQRSPGASLHTAEYGYSHSMQEKCAKNQIFFRRQSVVSYFGELRSRGGAPHAPHFCATLRKISSEACSQRPRPRHAYSPGVRAAQPPTASAARASSRPKPAGGYPCGLLSASAASLPHSTTNPSPTPRSGVCHLRVSS